MLGHQRVQPGEPIDVEFVDHGLRHRPTPIEWSGRWRVRHDDAEWHSGEGVGGVGHVVRLRDVVQDRPRVVDAARDRTGVRVEEQLGWVETRARGRIPWSVDSEAVALLGTDAMDEDGPDAIGIARHVVVELIAILIDQRELYPGRPGSPEPE